MLAGIRANQQRTSFYQKTSISPLVGIGTEIENYTASVRYLFPDLTSPNKVQAIEIAGERRWPLGRRDNFGLLLKGAGGIAHSRCNQTASGLIDRCTGAYGTVGFGFYF